MKRKAEESPKAPQAIDRHVAARIRQRRDELNITQEMIGEALGVTFQQFQKYENGKNRISAGRLFIIAELLGVQVSYFFEGLPTRRSKRRKGA